MPIPESEEIDALLLHILPIQFYKQIQGSSINHDFGNVPPIDINKSERDKARTLLTKLLIDSRFDELGKIPVIETTGVGYETIVQHRMKRFRELYNEQDKITELKGE